MLVSPRKPRKFVKMLRSTAFLCNAAVLVLLTRSLHFYTIWCNFTGFGEFPHNFRSCVIFMHFWEFGKFPKGWFLPGQPETMWKCKRAFLLKAGTFMKGEGSARPDAVGKFHHGVAQSPRHSGTFSGRGGAQSLTLTAISWGCTAPETFRSCHEGGAQSLTLSAKFIGAFHHVCATPGCSGTFMKGVHRA